MKMKWSKKSKSISRLKNVSRISPEFLKNYLRNVQCFNQIIGNFINRERFGRRERFFCQKVFIPEKK